MNIRTLMVGGETLYCMLGVKLNAKQCRRELDDQLNADTRRTYEYDSRKEIGYFSDRFLHTVGGATSEIFWPVFRLLQS